MALEATLASDQRADDTMGRTAIVLPRAHATVTLHEATTIARLVRVPTEPTIPIRKTAPIRQAAPTTPLAATLLRRVALADPLAVASEAHAQAEASVVAILAVVAEAILVVADANCYGRGFKPLKETTSIYIRHYYDENKIQYHRSIGPCGSSSVGPGNLSGHEVG